jgi:hypothetical protein
MLHATFVDKLPLCRNSEGLTWSECPVQIHSYVTRAAAKRNHSGRIAKYRSRSDVIVESADYKAIEDRGGAACR